MTNNAELREELEILMTVATIMQAINVMKIPKNKATGIALRLISKMAFESDWVESAGDDVGNLHQKFSEEIKFIKADMK